MSSAEKTIPFKPAKYQKWLAENLPGESEFGRWVWMRKILDGVTTLHGTVFFKTFNFAENSDSFSTAVALVGADDPPWVERTMKKGYM